MSHRQPHRASPNLPPALRRTSPASSIGAPEQALRQRRRGRRCPPPSRSKRAATFLTPARPPRARAKTTILMAGSAGFVEAECRARYPQRRAGRYQALAAGRKRNSAWCSRATPLLTLHMRRRRQRRLFPSKVRGRGRAARFADKGQGGIGTSSSSAAAPRRGLPSQLSGGPASKPAWRSPRGARLRPRPSCSSTKPLSRARQEAARPSLQFELKAAGTTAASARPSSTVNARPRRPRRSRCRGRESPSRATGRIIQQASPRRRSTRRRRPPRFVRRLSRQEQLPRRAASTGSGRRRVLVIPRRRAASHPLPPFARTGRGGDCRAGRRSSIHHRPSGPGKSSRSRPTGPPATEKPARRAPSQRGAISAPALTLPRRTRRRASSRRTVPSFGAAGSPPQPGRVRISGFGWTADASGRARGTTAEARESSAVP